MEREKISNGNKVSISGLEANEKRHNMNKFKEKGGVQNPVEYEAKPDLANLQQQVGNHAIQRLLAQHTSNSPTELDEDTIERINYERGGGQSLDGNIQARMSEATGQDFGNVKVHTGQESHALNEQLSAKAFITSSDIFFREGAYNPGSSSGQELLTHVIQQFSGAVGSGSGWGSFATFIPFCNYSVN